jgi:four helix bundle protein
VRASALSFVSNIAEGYERQTKAEFARFLWIAKASCGELRAQLIIAGDQNLITLADAEQLLDRCSKLSIGLRRFIDYLSKDPKPGKGEK